MSDLVRIRNIPHGITYRRNEKANGDLSGVSTIELRECSFRSKNAEYRARTSQIRAPEELYKEVYINSVKELKRRGELDKLII